MYQLTKSYYTCTFYTSQADSFYFKKFGLFRTTGHVSMEFRLVTDSLSIKFRANSVGLPLLAEPSAENGGLESCIVLRQIPYLNISAIAVCAWQMIGYGDVYLTVSYTSVPIKTACRCMKQQSRYLVRRQKVYDEHDRHSKGHTRDWRKPRYWARCHKLSC